MYESNKFFILNIPFMFLSRARARVHVEINVKDRKKCRECDEILSAGDSTWVAVVSRKSENESILAIAAEFRSIS